MAIDRNHQAAHPGLRVRIEPTVPDGLPTRIQTALRAGSPPDVIDAQHRWVVPYAQAGLLQPLDDALDSRRLLARIARLRHVGRELRGAVPPRNARGHLQPEHVREAGLDPDRPRET
jgi:hypothetical protein